MHDVALLKLQVPFGQIVITDPLVQKNPALQFETQDVDAAKLHFPLLQEVQFVLKVAPIKLLKLPAGQGVALMELKGQ